MCGILGICGFNDKSKVKSASEMIKHRGPNMYGYYSDKNIELAHRRLSIVDLSSNGKQPMYNEDESIVIIFNGEIYNYKKIKDKLKQKHEFKTNTDTEVIIHLYEELGEDCVKELDGDFAFAIWDSKKKKLFLARDRIGIKPLYYYQKGEKFIFSSEYKAILKFLDSYKINSQAIFDSLGWGFNPNDETCIKDIFALKPAHTLSLVKGKTSIRKYWDVNNSDENPKELPSLITQAVNERLMGDVPLGVYLSGGLDSSSVVALASKSQANLKTFSIGFESKKVIDETFFAEKVAKMYNTDHKSFYLNEDACKYWPKILWHLEEPISNLSAVPLYILSQKASKEVTIVLSGNGGDESFAGYRQHQLVYNAYKYSKHFPSTLLNAVSKIAQKTLPNKRIADFSRKFISHSNNPLLSYQDLMYKDLTEDEKRTLLKFNGESSSRFLKISKENLLNDLKYIDLRYRAPNNYLAVDDKINMASSIESRVPLFDHQIVEAAWKLKPSQQISLNDKKIYLKKFMKDKLPKEIIYRKKYGFTSPLAEWFNNYLINFKEITYKSNLFDKRYLDKLFSDVNSNKNINVLWPVINISLWHKIAFENKFDLNKTLKIK